MDEEEMYTLNKTEIFKTATQPGLEPGLRILPSM